MCADGYDYRTAARLHQDRLDEAESIRMARKAKAYRTAGKAGRTESVFSGLKKQLGRKLIRAGERLCEV